MINVTNDTQKRFNCTVVVLQTNKNDSNHLLFPFCFDPSWTCLQFKSEVHAILNAKYTHILLQHPQYYCDIGIISENLSPHDIFEIFDDSIMTDCITPNQTVYLYHPSINQDTVLLCDYNESASIVDDTDDCDYKSRQSMSISYQSYESVDTDMALDSSADLKARDTFFNSQNLFLAYTGNKYGVGQGGADESLRSQLVQISHSILIWALRKMDDLWKQKQTQDKLRQWLQMYSFQEKEIIDIIIFGNKLTDENALHLIEYSPWMSSEPKLSAATYDKLKVTEQTHSLPIQEEQKAIGDRQYVADHPFFHEFDEPQQPIDIYDVTFTDECNDPLDAALTEIEQNKKKNRQHKKDWPAQEGLFMYYYQFVYGLCNEDKFNQYIQKLGTIIGLTKDAAQYIKLLCKSEQDLARSLWRFAELDT